MKQYIKKLIQLFSLSTLLIVMTACMPKQSDGKYHSKYSYHPYYNLYSHKMSKKKKTSYITVHTKKSYKQYRPKKHSKVSYNDEDKYPSNVPANSY
jgi:hypothetical protein